MTRSKVSKNPLFVDLDGTFIKPDLLHESFVGSFKRNPFILFLAFVWLLKGRAYLKYQLAQRYDLNIELLPINPNFHDFILKEKQKTRIIILATASTEKYAQNICQHYDLFDSYICSSIDTNLVGKTKVNEILLMADEFDYAGNSLDDIPIFEKAKQKILVNSTNATRKLSQHLIFDTRLDDQQRNFTVWLKQLRTHQWLKNLLIFAPLLVSGLFKEIEYLPLSFLGFLSFCMMTSATYIINDLLDLKVDRAHYRKKYRPLASAIIPIPITALVSILLCIGSIMIALFLPSGFIKILLTYLLITLSYSLFAKRYPGIDVIILATLYTVRIIAGTILLNVTLSFWLLSFSMFVFFSLALVKRCAEIKSIEVQGKSHKNGRGYDVSDYYVLMTLGIASALMSVLMFIFYTNANIVSNQYQQPVLLWFIIPALSYWLIRIWLKTNKGEMYDDPIVFAIKDSGSLLIILFIIAVTFLAQLL